VRMNEWHAIRFMFGKRFKTAMLAFVITMLATVTLDLTQAILIGTLISAAIFLNELSSLDINIQERQVPSCEGSLHHRAALLRRHRQF